MEYFKLTERDTRNVAVKLWDSLLSDTRDSLSFKSISFDFYNPRYIVSDWIRRRTLMLQTIIIETLKHS